MYTAAVLTEQSRNQLLALVNSSIPENFEIIAHHMTVNLNSYKDGPLPQAGLNLGDKVKIQTMTLGQDAKVIAVGVKTECPSTNAIKHITIAVNRLAGGKPFHSNQLANWQPIQNIELEAIIEECQ